MADPFIEKKEWRDECTIGRQAEGMYWVRWTSPDGLYYWLHPETLVWVGEPEQIDMPTFRSVAAAKIALANVPEPVERR